MLKKDNKVYAQKKYKIKENICETHWSESGSEKNFPLPNKIIKIGNNDAVSADDMFTLVELEGIANYINHGPKTNAEAYIDFEKQLVLFSASKPIESGEEIVYTLNPSCLNNVKIQ